MKNFSGDDAVVGGFPAVSDSSERGIDGFVYGFVFTGSPGVLVDTYAREATPGYIKVLKKRYGLPELFALMHFHVKYLNKGLKVAVFVYVNKEGAETVSSWFEVDDRGNVVYIARKGLRSRETHKFKTNYYAWVYEPSR